MPISLPSLVYSNLLLIGALPALFFRRARITRFNAMWWVTAAPFFVCGWVMSHARRGEIVGWIDRQPFAATSEAIAVAASLGSIALIAAAWRAHREPPALWHQEDDQPAALVTGGPYARIRHPLYSAYLLALVAAVLAVPHPLTAVALATGWLLLDRTARREEQRLSASALGIAYRSYMRSTGRFAPRWRSAA